jgi:hypothetical protein
MTKGEFNKKVKEFLQTQDDFDKDEWYATDKDMAEEVTNKLRKFMFPRTKPIKKD